MVETSIAAPSLNMVTKSVEQKSAQILRMITFTLGGKAYGIDIFQVREITRVQHFTYVPNTAHYVRGLWSLRGDIVPIIDMRLFFNLEITGQDSKFDNTRNNEAYEDIIVLDFDESYIGIVVDHVSSVVEVNPDKIQAPHPLFSEFDLSYIDCIVDYEDSFYIILAIPRIIQPYWNPTNDLAISSSESITTNATSTNEETSLVHKKDLELNGLVLAKEENLVSKMASEIPCSNQNETLIKEVVKEELNPISELEVKNSENNGLVPEIVTSLSASSEMPINSELSIHNIESTFTQRVRQRLMESLAKEGFFVTPLNISFIEQQWSEWLHEQKLDLSENELLACAQNNCKEFVGRLNSSYYDCYWPIGFRDLLNLYFSNRTGNLNIWHIGSGNGRETYSLTASLVNAAPKAHLRVRAVDLDIMKVATASLLSVAALSELPEWLAEYLNKERGKNGYTFAKFLKDSIIFEYADGVYKKTYTKADLIVIRDVLSMQSPDNQEYILSIIDAASEENTLLIVGDGESLEAEDWELMESEPLRMYRKRLKT